MTQSPLRAQLSWTACALALACGVPSIASANPAVLSTSIEPAVMRAAKPVRVIVRTTPDVTSVTVIVRGAGTLDIPRTGPGRFELLTASSARARGFYAVTIVARDAKGRTATAKSGVTIR